MHFFFILEDITVHIKSEIKLLKNTVKRMSKLNVATQFKRVLAALSRCFPLFKVWRSTVKSLCPFVALQTVCLQTVVEVVVVVAPVGSFRALTSRCEPQAQHFQTVFWRENSICQKMFLFWRNVLKWFYGYHKDWEILLVNINSIFECWKAYFFKLKWYYLIWRPHWQWI